MAQTPHYLCNNKHLNDLSLSQQGITQNSLVSAYLSGLSVCQVCSELIGATALSVLCTNLLTLIHECECQTAVQHRIYLVLLNHTAMQTTKHEHNKFWN